MCSAAFIFLWYSYHLKTKSEASFFVLCKLVEYTLNIDLFFLDFFFLLSRILTARAGNTVEQFTFFIVRSTIFVLDDTEKIVDELFDINANREDRCVRIYFIVRAGVTRIVHNVLGKSLLCNLAFLNCCTPAKQQLFSVKTVQSKTIISLEHGIVFVLVFRI